MSDDSIGMQEVNELQAELHRAENQDMMRAKWKPIIERAVMTTGCDMNTLMVSRTQGWFVTPSGILIDISFQSAVGKTTELNLKVSCGREFSVCYTDEKSLIVALQAAMLHTCEPEGDVDKLRQTHNEYLISYWCLCNSPNSGTNQLTLDEIVQRTYLSSDTVRKSMKRLCQISQSGVKVVKDSIDIWNIEYCWHHDTNWPYKDCDIDIDVD